MGEESGLMDTHQQVYLACRSQDISNFHPPEERSDSGQIDRGKISCDFGDAEGEYVFDLPRDCLQRDLVGQCVPLLGLPPSHLEVLGNGCAR